MYHNPYEDDDTQDTGSNPFADTVSLAGKLALIVMVMGLLAYVAGATQCFGS